MNEAHAEVCGGAEWEAHMHQELLPTLTASLVLGHHVLEIGPGYGAATSWLVDRVDKVTAVEIDSALADRLVTKQAASPPSLEVIVGDASSLTFGDDTFDSVCCFTMLHHVPTVAIQNRLLAEALRVLKPGGPFFGSDSLASDRLHRLHTDDTYNPVEPSTLFVRLQTVGFDQVTVAAGESRMTFVAYKAAEPGPES
jgi:ubiquinone/menaquinone biosynthesis C-methylase UbiE